MRIHNPQNSKGQPLATKLDVEKALQDIETSGGEITIENTVEKDSPFAVSGGAVYKHVNAQVSAHAENEDIHTTAEEKEQIQTNKADIEELKKGVFDKVFVNDTEIIISRSSESGTDTSAKTGFNINLGANAKVTGDKHYGNANLGAKSTASGSSQFYGNTIAGYGSTFEAITYSPFVLASSSTVNAADQFKGNLIAGNDLTINDNNASGSVYQRGTWIVGGFANEGNFKAVNRYGLSLVGFGSSGYPSSSNSTRYKVYWPSRYEWAAEQYGNLKSTAEFNLIDADGEYIIQEGKFVGLNEEKVTEIVDSKLEDYATKEQVDTIEKALYMDGAHLLDGVSFEGEDNTIFFSAAQIDFPAQHIPTKFNELIINNVENTVSLETPLVAVCHFSNASNKANVLASATVISNEVSGWNAGEDVHFVFDNEVNVLDEYTRVTIYLVESTSSSAPANNNLTESNAPKIRFSTGDELYDWYDEKKAGNPPWTGVHKNKISNISFRNYVRINERLSNVEELEGNTNSRVSVLEGQVNSLLPLCGEIGGTTMYDPDKPPTAQAVYDLFMSENSGPIQSAMGSVMRFLQAHANNLILPDSSWEEFELPIDFKHVTLEQLEDIEKLSITEEHVLSETSTSEVTEDAEAKCIIFNKERLLDVARINRVDIPIPDRDSDTGFTTYLQLGIVNAETRALKEDSTFISTNAVTITRNETASFDFEDVIDLSSLDENETLALFFIPDKNNPVTDANNIGTGSATKCPNKCAAFMSDTDGDCQVYYANGWLPDKWQFKANLLEVEVERHNVIDLIKERLTALENSSGSDSGSIDEEQIQQIVEDLLAGYVRSEEVSEKVNEVLGTKDIVTSEQIADFVTHEEISDFITEDSISGIRESITGLEDSKANKTDIPENLVTEDSLSSSIESALEDKGYITEDSLSETLEGYVTSEDLESRLEGFETPEVDNSAIEALQARVGVIESDYATHSDVLERISDEQLELVNSLVVGEDTVVETSDRNFSATDTGAIRGIIFEKDKLNGLTRLSRVDFPAPSSNVGSTVYLQVGIASVEKSDGANDTITLTDKVSVVSSNSQRITANSTASFELERDIDLSSLEDNEGLALFFISDKDSKVTVEDDATAIRSKCTLCGIFGSSNDGDCNVFFNSWIAQKWEIKCSLVEVNSYKVIDRVNERIEALENSSGSGSGSVDEEQVQQIVEGVLSEYAKKSELPENVASVESVEAVDAKLEDYATKAEIEEFVNIEQVDVQIEASLLEYSTTEEVEALIEKEREITVSTANEDEISSYANTTFAIFDRKHTDSVKCLTGISLKTGQVGGDSKKKYIHVLAYDIENKKPVKWLGVSNENVGFGNNKKISFTFNNINLADIDDNLNIAIASHSSQDEPDLDATWKSTANLSTTEIDEVDELEGIGVVDVSSGDKSCTKNYLEDDYRQRLVVLDFVTLDRISHIEHVADDATSNLVKHIDDKDVHFTKDEILEEVKEIQGDYVTHSEIRPSYVTTHSYGDVTEEAANHKGRKFIIKSGEAYSLPRNVVIKSLTLFPSTDKGTSGYNGGGIYITINGEHRSINAPILDRYADNHEELGFTPVTWHFDGFVITGDGNDEIAAYQDVAPSSEAWMACKTDDSVNDGVSVFEDWGINKTICVPMYIVEYVDGNQLVASTNYVDEAISHSGFVTSEEVDAKISEALVSDSACECEPVDLSDIKDSLYGKPTLVGDADSFDGSETIPLAAFEVSYADEHVPAKLKSFIIHDVQNSVVLEEPLIATATGGITSNAIYSWNEGDDLEFVFDESIDITSLPVVQGQGKRLNVNFTSLPNSVDPDTLPLVRLDSNITYNWWKNAKGNNTGGGAWLGGWANHAPNISFRCGALDERVDSLEHNLAGIDGLIDSALQEKDIVTHEELSEATNGFITDSALEDKGYLTSSDLEGYVTSDALSGYVTNEQIANLGDTYATKEEIESFVTSEQVTNIVEEQTQDVVTTEDVQQIVFTTVEGKLSEHNFIDEDGLESKLEGYAKKDKFEELEQTVQTLQSLVESLQSELQSTKLENITLKTWVEENFIKGAVISKEELPEESERKDGFNYIIKPSED